MDMFSEEISVPEGFAYNIEDEVSIVNYLYKVPDPLNKIYKYVATTFFLGGQQMLYGLPQESTINIDRLKHVSGKNTLRFSDLTRVPHGFF